MQPIQQEQARYSHAEDLGGLELLQARFHRQCFSRHVHEGYCIGVIESGAQCFYRSGGNHIAPRDSIILVNADQVHDGHRATDAGWAYQAMYPTPEMLAPVSLELEGSGAPYFPEPVVYDPALAAQLRRLFSVIEQSDNTLERETYYLAVMVSLIQRHGRSHPELPALGREAGPMRRVKDYLDAHINVNVSLQTLSALTGLNPHYLTRLFQKTFGLPPHAYQVQRRLQIAKRLIRQGVALTDVALDTGFTDQSHLSRHFKRYLGVTPGQYQRNLQVR